MKFSLVALLSLTSLLAATSAQEFSDYYENNNLVEEEERAEYQREKRVRPRHQGFQEEEGRCGQCIKEECVSPANCVAGKKEFVAQRAVKEFDF